MSLPIKLPIEFFAAGNPVGYKRPRFRPQGGSYLDPKCKAWRESIVVQLREAGFTGNPVKHECDIVLRFWFKDGRSYNQDLDNLCKEVLDALSGVVWEDDRQVANLRASKCRLCSNPGGKPGVGVRVDIAF